MKYFWLACEAMADEAREELGGKTPLQIAKTPALDVLAKRSRLGGAVWAPASLPATSDVAAFSMLGYDPKEFYTGLAPLEAASTGVRMNDAAVAFRCDFITVSEGQELVDPAVPLSEAESKVLLKELQSAFGDAKFRLQSLGDNRNLLLVEDPAMAEAMDELECFSPAQLRGQDLTRFAPKGRSADILNGWMAKSRKVLENHDVNRVRIDLGENPATMLWFWGQGRSPRLSPFSERTHKQGAYYVHTPSWNGVARLAGLSPMRSLKKDSFAEFNWIQVPSPAQALADYKARVRYIEDFDAKVLGSLMKEIASLKEETRILVTSDFVCPSIKGLNQHAASPVMWTDGGSGSGIEEFSEKNCGLSGVQFDPGHTFLETFLKG